jgi:hypothetical protein
MRYPPGGSIWVFWTALQLGHHGHRLQNWGVNMLTGRQIIIMTVLIILTLSMSEGPGVLLFHNAASLSFYNTHELNSHPPIPVPRLKI